MLYWIVVPLLAMYLLSDLSVSQLLAEFNPEWSEVIQAVLYYGYFVYMIYHPRKDDTQILYSHSANIDAILKHLMTSDFMITKQDERHSVLVKGKKIFSKEIIIITHEGAILQVKGTNKYIDPLSDYRIRYRSMTG